MRPLGRAFSLHFCPIAGEITAGERAPRNQRNTLVYAQRIHLALFFSVDQVVVVLHGDKPMPAILFGRIERLGELPGGHAAGSEVAHLAGADEAIQRFERFFNRRGKVPAVNLIQVDIVHFEAAQGILAGFDDMLTAQSPSVRTIAHGSVDLGRQDNIVACSHLAQPFAGDFFAHTNRVDIRGIKKSHARFKGEGEVLARRVFPDGPLAPFAIPVAHAPHTDARNRHPRIPKLCVLHAFSNLVDGLSSARIPPLRLVPYPLLPLEWLGHYQFFVYLFNRRILSEA